jgi:hypothetical protein
MYQVIGDVKVGTVEAVASILAIQLDELGLFAHWASLT